MVDTVLYKSRINYMRKHQPATLVFSVILPIPGIMAIILGDDVSQALTNLGAGVYSRIMGILLTVGCLMIFTSIITNKSLLTVVGMTIAATGCFFYGIGVIIGLLPFGGIVAGFGFLAIGSFFVLRLTTITQVASIVYTNEHNNGH